MDGASAVRASAGSKLPFVKLEIIACDISKHNRLAETRWVQEVRLELPVDIPGGGVCLVNRQAFANLDQDQEKSDSELFEEVLGALRPAICFDLFKTIVFPSSLADWTHGQVVLGKRRVQVQGHILIAKISKKFRLDKGKGMSLSQQHLLALKPQQNEIKDHEIFRDRVEFVLSGLETSDYPAESILRAWIYDCLKSIPRMSLRVDKYREASVGSPQRSFQFLWQSMIEIMDEAQYDQNAISILSNLKVKVDAAPGQPNPTDKKKHDKEAEPRPKPKAKAAAVPIVPPAFALSSVFPTGANAVKSTVSSFMPRLFKTVNCCDHIAFCFKHDIHSAGLDRCS